MVARPTHQGRQRTNHLRCSCQSNRRWWWQTTDPSDRDRMCVCLCRHTDASGVELYRALDTAPLTRHDGPVNAKGARCQTAVYTRVITPPPVPRLVHPSASFYSFTAHNAACMLILISLRVGVVCSTRLFPPWLRSLWPIALLVKHDLQSRLARWQSWWTWRYS